MNIDSQVVSVPVNVAYGQQAGTLGTKTKTDDNKETIKWWTCREQFHSHADPLFLKEYYFVCGTNRGTDVAHFIYKMEEKLGLNEKTQFCFTNKTNVIIVKTTNWWVKNPMRHSLLTIALRSGMMWRREAGMDWRSVMLAHTYAGTTWKAVDMFMAGRTWYTGITVGWTRQFSGFDLNRDLTQAELDKFLVTPDDEIRRLAYKKWEEAGRPFGRDVEFWEKACQSIVSK